MLNRLAFAAVVCAAWALASAAGPGGGVELLPGVKLTAGDQPIDDKSLGHFAPTVADLNGDGKKDLIIGMFRGAPGNIWFYPNVGTDAEPKFEKYTVLEAGGAPIKLTGA